MSPNTCKRSNCSNHSFEGNFQSKPVSVAHTFPRQAFRVMSESSCQLELTAHETPRDIDSGIECTQGNHGCRMQKSSCMSRPTSSSALYLSVIACDCFHNAPDLVSLSCVPAYFCLNGALLLQVKQKSYGKTDFSKLHCNYVKRQTTRLSQHDVTNRASQ